MSHRKEKYQIEKVISSDGPVLLIKTNRQQLVLKKYVINHDSRQGLKPEVFTELMVLNAVRGLQNLLQVQEVIFGKSDIRFVLEYLEGGTIDVLIKKWLPKEQIADVIRQSLIGLVQLHSRGIIHNDLKPQNIMFRPNSESNKSDFEVKIIDFGLSYLVNFPYYLARNISGTHHYTPPEYREHRDVGRVSVNSDIYCLGIIFYYLINPDAFTELDDNAESHQIFDPHYIDWEVVNQRVGRSGSDLLHRMLDFDPDRRISSKMALSHPFFYETHHDEETTSQKNKKRRSKTKSKKSKRSRSKRSRSKSSNSKPSSDHKSRGGNRRWEEPRLMTIEEWKHPRNAESFLPEIVNMSMQTKNIFADSHTIPNYVWKIFYEQFESLEIKFISLNYAMILLHQYLDALSEKYNQSWEPLVFACLLISVKLNEYSFHFNSESFDYPDTHAILEMERHVVETLVTKSHGLLLPIAVSKEVILFYYYLETIYSGVEMRAAVYNHYFLLNLISSLLYTDAQLSVAPKFDVITALLSLGFPEKIFNKRVKIAGSKNLKKQIVELLAKRMQHLKWIDRDLFSFISS